MLQPSSTLSQMGSKVSLMDADFAWNAHIMFGINQKNHKNMLKNGLPVEDVIESGPN